MAIHWRYNEEDWLHGGCSKRKARIKKILI